MKMRLLCVAAAICLISGCAPAAPEARSSTIFAMDTVMELRVYGDDALLNEAAALIGRLEKALSVTDTESEIYNVNASGSGNVGADTAELLSEALALCKRTDGALDITVYPVVRAWGFTTGDYRVPDDAEISALLEKVDYSRVELSGGKVTLGDGQMLDLGGVAKGYAGSKVAELWRESGVKSALINLGGNVHAIGAKPDGSPWSVAIQDPFGDGYLGILKIVDKAVITSGGYERCFVDNGRTYWHIMDPADGRPADSGLASVTVIGSDGTVCDGLSTALFVMGLERAAELWRESSDFEAVFVTSGGEVYITSGIEDGFELSGNYKNAEIQVIRRD